MDFRPRRTQGTLIGSGFLLVLLAAAATGLDQLDVSPVTPWILLWVLLPLVSLPLMALVAYRLYGLWTATYRMDRDGFSLRWGLVREQIPLGMVTAVHRIQELDDPPRAPVGWWWPGCVAAPARGDVRPPTEIFVGSGPAGGVLVESNERRLVIAPADAAAFVKAFTDATRLGSLHPISALSERPSFVFADAWKDLPARGLILAGALLPLALLAFVGWTAAGLSGSVPFGFDAFGNPGPDAPPGRLLLLPMMAGVLWVIDLGLGTWLYRAESERRLAYTVWAVAIISGLLLWGAVLHLIYRA
jgi:hypothetical protein